jgi:regulator of cell morphogenesis and NO signaling
MTITLDTQVADIAVGDPGTIRVFQRHQIDFCCGGRIPLEEACTSRGLDASSVLAELRAVGAPQSDGPNWSMVPLTALIAHIQTRYHEHLRVELPRLHGMVLKVVSRHGARLPETLLPLRDTFEALQTDLLNHMHKEDAILFPAITYAEEAIGEGGVPVPIPWIEQPIDVMEREHDEAGQALETMRRLTDDYTPPDDACPTFRGLYHGLAELESDMHVHVHLENHVLFPRAIEMARRAR